MKRTTIYNQPQHNIVARIFYARFYHFVFVCIYIYIYKYKRIYVVSWLHMIVCECVYVMLCIEYVIICFGVFAVVTHSVLLIYIYISIYLWSDVCGVIDCERSTVIIIVIFSTDCSSCNSSLVRFIKKNMYGFTKYIYVCHIGCLLTFSMFSWEIRRLILNLLVKYYYGFFALMLWLEWLLNIDLMYYFLFITDELYINGFLEINLERKQ